MNQEMDFWNECTINVAGAGFGVGSVRKSRVAASSRGRSGANTAVTLTSPKMSTCKNADECGSQQQMDQISEEQIS